MRYAAVVGVMVALCASAPSVQAQAQDQREAMRAVAKKWQDAIVNVRVSLKVRMSMGGREVQSMDDTVEAVATVIDPSGLTVMSLSSLDPGAMMSRIMGATAQGAEKTRHRVRLDDDRVAVDVELEPHQPFRHTPPAGAPQFVPG